MEIKLETSVYEEVSTNRDTGADNEEILPSKAAFLAMLLGCTAGTEDACYNGKSPTGG